MIPPFSHIGSRRHSPNYYEFADEGAPPSNLMAAFELIPLNRCSGSVPLQPLVVVNVLKCLLFRAPYWPTSLAGRIR